MQKKRGVQYFNSIKDKRKGKLQIASGWTNTHERDHWRQTRFYTTYKHDKGWGKLCLKWNQTTEYIMLIKAVECIWEFLEPLYRNKMQ